MPPITLSFDNTYARDLAGLHVPWQPAAAPAPRRLFLNRGLADELGLQGLAPEGADGDDGAAFFAGNVLPEGAEPIAQAYAGHQFGGFSPQLGDGRALLLGEVIDRQGRRRDIAFKGSGRTPFSRGGDGKAAVGPMLREVLIGEAMHALGIPTTRALAVAATGDRVVRERMLPGAVLTRVAASHLRVGTFQFFAARGETGRLRQLADYAIARHDPALAGDDPGRFLGLLRAVMQRQAALLAQWMNVGFIHGVMNTDNMTISGETIDYGPCAFMEAFDPQAVFSSIDHQGRYAYGQQPQIALWNLARLAEALLPLVAEMEGGVDGAAAAVQAAGAAEADEAKKSAAAGRAVERVTAVLDGFPGLFRAHLLQGQRAKLGLLPAGGAADLGEAGAEAAARGAADTALVEDWLALLHAERVDYTLAWRRLADAAAGDEAPLRALFTQAGAPDAWLLRWRARGAGLDGPGADPLQAGRARAQAMRLVNPWVIPRNHRVEEALAAATDEGDLALFDRLLDALRRPFDDAPDQALYAVPAPAGVTACYRTFCGT